MKGIIGEAADILTKRPDLLRRWLLGLDRVNKRFMLMKQHVTAGPNESLLVHSAEVHSASTFSPEPVDARQSARLVTLLGCIPRIEQRLEEAEIAIASACLQPWQRAVDPVLLHGIGYQQKPGIGGQLGRRDLAREAEREVDPPRSERLGQRLLRELNLAWPDINQRGEQFRRSRMLAVDGRRPRLDVGQCRITGREARRCRCRNKQHRRERGAAKELTCWGNWGLRRLRG